MNTAVAHHRAGQTAEAVALYQRILDAEPEFADARHLLGVVALQSGQLADAERQIRTAIQLQPEDGEYWNNLGVALKRMGRFADALAAYAQAVEWTPRSADYWINFADCARSTSIESYDQRLNDTVLACFVRDDIDHRQLTAIATSLLRFGEPTAAFFNTEAREAALETWLGSGTETVWLDDSLLLEMLQRAIVSHGDLEIALTRTRSLLLSRVSDSPPPPPKPTARTITFAAALALQCFANEYAFAVTADENVLVEKLRARLSTARSLPPAERLRLAVYASYEPLYHLANAPSARTGNAAGNAFAELLYRQVREPRLENTLRHRLPSLGNISDRISRAVQNQYEENPYPRWRTFNRLPSRPLDVTLKQLFPHVPSAGGHAVVAASKPLQVLVAGCGTGRQALTAAQRHANAKVLAVDLSRASLGYAVRMAEQAEIRNVEFAQADILELGAIERRFDLIECTGVLHHLGEPITGWRILSGLLKDRGWMKIGLYSEIARATHVVAQNFVRDHGYPATPQGLRDARRDILALPGDHPVRPIAERANFYTLSECRDLIFHVQEHRFSLPEISRALTELRLEFIGFEFLDSVHSQRYRERFPSDREARSLDNWHRFEVDNPATFLGMYQFWVRASA